MKDDGWTKETWEAFYYAVKPFMEGTHESIRKDGGSADTAKPASVEPTPGETETTPAIHPMSKFNGRSWLSLSEAERDQCFIFQIGEKVIVRIDGAAGNTGPLKDEILDRQYDPSAGLVYLLKMYKRSETWISENYLSAIPKRRRGKGAFAGDPTPDPTAKKNGWAIWIDVNRERGLGTPAPMGPDTAASKALRAAYKDDAGLIRVMNAYLDDETYMPASQSGHALRHLPGRVNLYRVGGPTQGDELEAEANAALLKVRGDAKKKTLLEQVNEVRKLHGQEPLDELPKTAKETKKIG